MDSPGCDQSPVKVNQAIKLIKKVAIIIFTLNIQINLIYCQVSLTNLFAIAFSIDYPMHFSLLTFRQYLHYKFTLCLIFGEDT